MELHSIELMKIITGQIRTKNAVNGNYVEYESKEDKDKNVSP